MLIPFLCGIILTTQVGLNTTIAKSVASPIWASAIAFAVGTIGLFAYFFVTRSPWPSMQMIATVPPYAWAGGLLAAFYVAATVIAAPKIGAAVLVSFVVAGQMTAALLLDHYGAIGFPQQSISWLRLFGGVMIVIGVIFIQKF